MGAQCNHSDHYERDRKTRAKEGDMGMEAKVKCLQPGARNAGSLRQLEKGEHKFLPRVPRSLRF